MSALLLLYPGGGTNKESHIRRGNVGAFAQYLTAAHDT